MRLLVATLSLFLLISGCLDDEGDNEDPIVEDEMDAMDDGNMTMELEDLGEYTLDPATGQCDAKDYTEPAPGLYESAFGGGTWVIQESNGIPGLQYEDNHPGSGSGAGFELAVDDRCTNGDQILV